MGLSATILMVCNRGLGTKVFQRRKRTEYMQSAAGTWLETCRRRSLGQFLPLQTLAYQKNILHICRNPSDRAEPRRSRGRGFRFRALHIAYVIARRGLSFASPFCYRNPRMKTFKAMPPHQGSATRTYKSSASRVETGKASRLLRGVI